MTRTVSAKLQLDVAEYVKSARSAKLETSVLEDKLKGLGTTSDRTKPSLDGLGRSAAGSGRVAKATARDFTEMRRDLQNLDRQILTTEAALGSLAKAFSRTGDAKLLDQIRQQKTALGQLLDVRRLLPKPDEQASQDYGRSLWDGISAGLKGAAAGSPGIIAAGAIGAALAPTIGAAIGSTLAAGVGGAAIIGGIALLAKDPQIAVAGKAVGSKFAQGLRGEAQVFKAPVLQAIGQLEAAAVRTTGKIGKVFDNTAPSVKGLTSSLIGAGDALADSLVVASSRSGPALTALGGLVENVGASVGDFLESATANSKAGASAIDDLSMSIGNFVRVSGDAVQGLTAIKGGLDSFDDAIDKGRYWLEDHSFTLDLTADGYKRGSEAAELYRKGVIGAAGSTHDYNAYLKGAADGTSNFATKMTDAERAARGERDALVGLSNQLRAQADPVFALLTAEDGLRAAKVKSADAIKKHGQNSTEAKAATRELASAALDLEGKAGALGKTFNGQLTPQLRATLRAAGLTAPEIANVAGQFRAAKRDGDAFARKYAANVAVNGAPAAMNRVRSLKAELASMKTNWSVTVRTNFLTFGKPYSQTPSPSHAGGLARGGAMIPMAEGGVYPATNPPLMKFAEPETGGELYMPRRGISRSRAQGLLAEGASWYGMAVRPMAGGGITAAASGLVNVAAADPVAAVARPSRLEFVDSNLSARSAVQSLSTALKENGRSFTFNTQKGRDNQTSLIAGIKAAQDAAKAKYAETGSVKAANAVYDSYARGLNRIMQLHGVTAASRRTLLRAFSERPKYDLPAAAAAAGPSDSSKIIAQMQGRIGAQQQVEEAAAAFAWTKPSFTSTTAAGRSELNQLFSFLAAAQTAAQSTYDQSGNAGTATGIYNTYLDQLRAILTRSGMKPAEINTLLQTYGRITLARNRWGGIHAAGGSLRDAQIAPGGPTRYAWAEPETGGEAFIPRRGDRARSTAIWRHVGEQWLNQPTWRSAPAGGGQTAGPRHMSITVPVALDLGGGDRIQRRMELVVDAALGKLTSAIVHQAA